MTLTINKKTYEAGELVAYVEKLEKENTELKEISKLLLWDLRSRDYDAKDVERAERFLKECGLEGIM